MGHSYAIRVSDELYLEHHGILGQKWGKKNGPPYPLDASDHSASEKKAGWRASLKASKSVNSAKAAIRNGLTDEQKETVKKVVKVGAIAAGTALAAYGGYKLGATGKLVSIGKKAIPIAKAAAKKAGNIAKEGATQFGKKTIEGIPKGMGAAGDKLGKAIGFAITGLAAKEVLDIVAGEDFYKTVADVWNTNNKKDRINFEKRKRKDEDDD